MKYYIISVEASVDLHVSNLMKGLHQEDPEAEFRVWGGDLMAAAGGADAAASARASAYCDLRTRRYHSDSSRTCFSV